MAYNIAFTKRATKTLQKIPSATARQIRAKIEQIAVDPFAPNSNVTILQNRDGYRLRVGDWRVIYEIQQEKVLVLVLKIGLRGEVYR
jgi:mRNA interferase RelE/StbE